MAEPFDINEMEALLGIPVVPISAAKNEGIEELVSHALHVAQVSGKAEDDRISAMRVIMAVRFTAVCMVLCI